MDPLWKSVEVTERFEGKIEPLSDRQQTAKNVGDPTYEFWIVPQRHLESHGWRRQPRLLENLVKSEAHLRVCARTPKGLVDHGSGRRPQRQACRQQKKRRPRQLVESNHSAGTKQLRQRAQHSRGIGEKHQDETTHDGVEGFATRDL